MASPHPQEEREKTASKLPPAFRQELKVRAAELGLDIQDAVTHAITTWRTQAGSAPVDTTGAESFSTWLPVGLYDAFKETCAERGVSYVQGLAQAIRRWLDTNPSPGAQPAAGVVRRIIVCNQKGGVGKTALSAGLAQAFAEEVGDDNGFAGQRVLLVDYDPQGHLTEQLGLTQIPPDAPDSLVEHMVGAGEGDLKDLIVTIDDPRFGKRLDVLPSCFDAFILDARMGVKAATGRGYNKEEALDLALGPVEADYDVIIIDCPPSLGMAMDAALFYGRRRPGEPVGRSGAVIPVLAEDTSATAYRMLAGQIEDLRIDFRIDIDYLGLVVNLYDGRRGYVATSSLAAWKAIQDPPVLAVIGDLKEQREAVRQVRPLLSYAPHSEQAEAMRQIARRVS